MNRDEDPKYEPPRELPASLPSLFVRPDPDAIPWGARRRVVSTIDCPIAGSLVIVIGDVPRNARRSLVVSTDTDATLWTIDKRDLRARRARFAHEQEDHS